MHRHHHVDPSPCVSRLRSTVSVSARPERTECFPHGDTPLWSDPRPRARLRLVVLSPTRHPIPGRRASVLIVHSRASLLVAAVTLALVASPSPMQAQEVSGATGAARTESGLESRKPFAAFSASAERLREGIVERARESLGAKYKLGASKAGVAFDCSGLVRYVMGVLDISLPRTAQEQSKVGVEVPRDVAALKPGDVLTFGRGKRISHVGIYVGNGKMIHASTSKRRVIETSLDRRSSLIRQWQGVRRYVDGSAKVFSDSILAFADSLK